MKYEQRIVDEARGIVQITTADERWYKIEEKDKPARFMPSVTWICGYYPKGIGFMKWLSEHGWDEAEAVKQAAGDKGSKVHRAISDILKGAVVKIDDKYGNNDGDEPTELTVAEYEAIISFVNWLNEIQPEVMAVDYTLVNEKENYAGTIDMKLKIKGEIWIVDIKTSKDVYPSHEIQVSAYKQADKEVQKIAILQVGYARNKAKFKFTEVQDQFPLFQAAKAIWAKETEGVFPKQRDFPLEVKWNKVIDPAIKEVKPRKKVVRKKKTK